MIIKEITDYLDGLFPAEYQEDYDNTGLLVGNPGAETTGVLTTTDITDDVIDEAIAMGANLIVSHHPIIFGGLKRLTPQNTAGRLALRLAERGICAYAAHTNLDNLACGVNGILAEKLGIVNCRILQVKGISDEDDTFGAGMIGLLPSPMALDDFFAMVKERLHLPVVRASKFKIKDSELKIKNVAICGGSGAFLIGDAIAAGADILLTADLKYHDFQMADNDIIVADIGHFESEQFAKEIFYNAISKKFSTFACRISEKDTGYIRYI